MPERKWIARYGVSPVIFGRDSRESTPNPDYHPAILFDGDEFFLEDGTVLSRDDIPVNILEMADALVPAPPPRKAPTEVSVKEILDGEVPFVDEAQKFHPVKRKK
jgi:hypothetical protein